MGSATNAAEAVEDDQPIAGRAVGADALEHGLGEVGAEVLVVQRAHDGAELVGFESGVAAKADPHGVGARAQPDLAEQPGAHQLGEDGRPEEATAHARDGADHPAVVPDERAVEVEEGDGAHGGAEASTAPAGANDAGWARTRA